MERMSLFMAEYTDIQQSSAISEGPQVKTANLAELDRDSSTAFCTICLIGGRPAMKLVDALVGNARRPSFPYNDGKSSFRTKVLIWRYSLKGHYETLVHKHSTKTSLNVDNSTGTKKLVF
jgi:hypothetical protein